jgi:hypothetical protein
MSSSSVDCPICLQPRRCFHGDNLDFICNIDAGDNDSECVMTLCYHKFHKKCLEPWIQRNPTCPVCRATLELSDLNHLLVCIHWLEQDKTVWFLLKLSFEQFRVLRQTLIWLDQSKKQGRLEIHKIGTIVDFGKDKELPRFSRHIFMTTRFGAPVPQDLILSEVTMNDLQAIPNIKPLLEKGILNP